MQMKKWKKCIVYLPYLFALVLFLYLYRYSFPQGDDFTFATRGGTLPRVWNYYLYYYTYAGSRMANLFASLLLLAGLSVWKVLTPFVTQGIALLLFYCVTGRLLPQEGRLKRDFSLACICAFFPGLIPLSYHLFADTFLWMDGSCNYLYSLFFFLFGFLPFWNALRGRPLPRSLKWICPVFFLAAGLMHEQIAMALFILCAVSLFLLHKNGHISKYLTTLSAISLAVLIFTFTCPGAYYRLNETKQGANGNLLHRLFDHFLAYFTQFDNGLWPITFLLGLCALYFLRRRPGWFASTLRFFIGFGTALAPLSQFLSLPVLQSSVTHAGLKATLLLLYWMLFFVALLPAFILPLRKEPENRYAVVLYLSMWGSQAIPAALGSVGRPVLPLAVLALLLALCIADNIRHRLITTAQLCTAAVGFCAVVNMFSPVAANYASYKKIAQQVTDAKAGRINTVRIDQQAFDSKYCYFNSFSSAYRYDIQQYYQLKKDIVLDFSHHVKTK